MQKLKDRLGRSGISAGLLLTLLMIVVMALIVNVVKGVNFFSINNLLNVARNYSMIAIAAMGQTFVIITGGLDLSVSAVMATSNVIAATYMTSNGLILPVMLLSLLMAALVGLLNGLLVTKRNVPPFICTLGTAIVVNGLRMIWTNGMPRGAIPDGLKGLCTSNLFNFIPNLFVIFVIIAVFYWVLLGKTGFGRRLYVVGNNPAVADLSGLKREKIIITAYIISAMSAAFVGILIGGYTGIADNWAGKGYDLDSVAFAVLGGAVIGGGSGTIQGTILGGFILLMITNLALLASLPLESQLIIKGFVIVVALGISGRKK
ncbi:MAG: ABC transporter permease [Spirochaetales bacterium]|nr:ABC transporter permease [Spirochaetales bacterium]